MTESTTDLLRTHLSAFVPIRMAELSQSGGPTAGDLGRCRGFAQNLAEHGDEVLYRSRRAGDTGKLIGELTEALAILAFAPGGVDLVGLHFEAQAKASTH